MKIFAINKSQAAVLTTLGILLFLGATYFFIYLPQNERRISEQRFKALQNIDLNIHTKIENSIALLNNVLTNYLKEGDDQRQRITKYIRGYSSTNFTITAPTAAPRPKAGPARDSIDVDSVYTIKVNNDTREISLFFSKLGLDESRKDTMVYKINMKFSFRQFIMFLLPKDIFDDYVVFSDEKPVYESFPAGISFIKRDSLLSAGKGIGSSGVRNQVISGKDYKMFLQPVGFDAHNEWIIGGLVSSKHYQKEKTQLPTQMILLLATIMLIGMVAFPWLKLYQMGSKDRLTIADGVASIFISMLLVSLVFFLFFNYNHSFRPKEKNESKITLANAISTAFRNEIDTVVHKLQQLDTLGRRSIDIINLNKDAISYASGTDTVENATEIGKIVGNININQVFWLNKNGEETTNWTADKMNAPHGVFKSREYFKKIANDRGYQLYSSPGKSYFLEQVISWTSGTFRSVISMKSGKSTTDSIVVVALSFNFKSIDKVILPTGFLFAITDNLGNVLYHSDSSRNLNENLLNVFSKPDKLTSCLNAKIPSTFSTKYYGNDYDVQVMPVNGLPYSIVIFEDAVYNETTGMEIYSFTFSMLLFFFGFLVLQLFSTFLVSARRSFLKKKVLDTSWIGPKKTSHKEYLLASVFNVMIIFLLVIFFNRSSFLQYLFMLLFSVTFIPLFLNIIFARRYVKEKRNVSRFKISAIYCLSVFIIIIGVLAFKTLAFRYFFLYELLVFILGIALYLIREKVYDMADYVKGRKLFRPMLKNWNYVNSFALMALTRLVITSGLPVIFFYINAYNFEQNLSVRYKQIDFANRLIDKFPGVPPQSILNPGTWNGVYLDSNFISHMSVIPQDSVFAALNRNAYSNEDFKTIGLLKLFRLYMTDKAIQEDNYYSSGATDNSFGFNNLMKEACTDGKGTITYRQSSEAGEYLKFQSSNLNYHYPAVISMNGFNGGLFWLLLAASLIVFYFIIDTIIKKLFSLNLPNLEVWKRLDKEILKNKTWDQPLFVIGLPGSGKKQYLLDKIRNKEIVLDSDTPLYYDDDDESKNNVFIAELINIPSSGNEETEKALWIKYTKKVFDPKNRMIIVNHFEYNIQDALSNRFKLEFLERLYLENKCKIVILSTIHPVAFLDSAMDPLFRQEGQTVPGQDLERWHVLLGHYRIIVLPLQLDSLRSPDMLLKGSVVDDENGKGIAGVSISIEGISKEIFTKHDGSFVLPDHTMPFTITVSLEGFTTRALQITDSNQLSKIPLEKNEFFGSSELTRNETNHTYFLKKLQSPAYKAAEELDEDMRLAKFDELTFKLQVSSHYFYMYIWQSLTKEEKFLLYDLAEDNLVNSFDDYNLSMLIAKGVVIRPDGTLKLFNNGFRNFILTAIGNSEAIKIKHQIKENGNWNTLKNPLQLVILAILAFLLISQEEAFGKLITYVAALGAGVPTVLKLFSMFDKSNQKQG
ncbi:MAG: carboxypeptidase-like regulatory domain-containing protein [Ferruginibacter sp.]